MKKMILTIALIAMIAGVTFAANGPIRATVVTGTTSGVKVPLETITAGVSNGYTPHEVYVSCVDDDFQVLAWKYNGTTFELAHPVVAADTLTSGALANSFLKVLGNFDFLVIKTATGDASVGVQEYNY